MSRLLPLTLCLLLIVSILLVPALGTNAQDRLPTPNDFTAADSKCRIKKRVYAHVSSRALVFGKTTECSLLVHSCKPKPTLYRSDARPSKQDVCEDYYETAYALTGHRICCDRAEPDAKKPPERKSSDGGGKPTPGGKGSTDEGEGGGMTLDADLAVSIQAPQRYPVGVTPFAVTVLNRGPGPATAVRLTGFITLGQLNSATTSQGKCSVDGSNFNCDFGTISNSGSRSVSLQARTETNGRAEITADVTSGTPDRIPANNHAAAAIDVKYAVKGTWSPPKK